MPIRTEAALKLANDILGTYVQSGHCYVGTLHTAAKLIELAVEIDEINVRNAQLREERVALERRPA